MTSVCHIDSVHSQRLAVITILLLQSEKFSTVFLSLILLFKRGHFLNVVRCTCPEIAYSGFRVQTLIYFQYSMLHFFSGSRDGQYIPRWGPETGKFGNLWTLVYRQKAVRCGSANPPKLLSDWSSQQTCKLSLKFLLSQYHSRMYEYERYIYRTCI